MHFLKACGVTLASSASFYAFCNGLFIKGWEGIVWLGLMGIVGCTLIVYNALLKRSRAEAFIQAFGLVAGSGLSGYAIYLGVEGPSQWAGGLPFFGFLGLIAFTARVAGVLGGEKPED